MKFYFWNFYYILLTKLKIGSIMAIKADNLLENLWHELSELLFGLKNLQKKVSEEIKTETACI
jgi:membrane-associated PAP2 superfamily phosphatase